MPDQTQRRKEADQIPDLENLGKFILTEPDPIEIGEGYSISIKYDSDGRPQIYVKKYGNIDTRGLRRKIERSYPGAVIQGLEKPKQIKLAHPEIEKPEDEDSTTHENRVNKKEKQREL
jgi:hypothetical protein